jgi:membrane protease YdiL (CAAX protease family)
MAISCAVLALAALPFWLLPEGIGHPLYSWVIGLGMFGPAIASAVLAKCVERTSWRTRVGLRFRGRWTRLLLWSPLAVLVVVALHAIAALIMVLRGVPGDLTGRTWYESGQAAYVEALGTEVHPAVLVLSVLLIAAAGLAVTSVSALGEEIGWRGWLWPALKPLGIVPGAVVGGVLWSLWHLPIMLIGHNYPGSPRPAAIAMFVLPCIAMTLLFGALTERAGGNPIPAALAHGAVNSLGGSIIVLVATAETTAAMSLYVDTLLGVTGAALMAATGLVLMPWSRLRRRARGAGTAATRSAGADAPDGAAGPCAPAPAAGADAPDGSVRRPGPASGANRVGRGRTGRTGTRPPGDEPGVLASVRIRPAPGPRPPRSRRRARRGRAARGRRRGRRRAAGSRRGPGSAAARRRGSSTRARSRRAGCNARPARR